MSVSKKLNKQRFLKSIAREIKQSYHDLVSILTPKKKTVNQLKTKLIFEVDVQTRDIWTWLNEPFTKAIPLDYLESWLEATPKVGNSTRI